MQTHSKRVQSDKVAFATRAHSRRTRYLLRPFWVQITCPTLLVVDRAINALQDSRSAHFQNAEVAALDDADHWVHHNQLDAFLARTREIIACS